MTAAGRAFGKTSQGLQLGSEGFGWRRRAEWHPRSALDMSGLKVWVSRRGRWRRRGRGAKVRLLPPFQVPGPAWGPEHLGDRCWPGSGVTSGLDQGRLLQIELGRSGDCRWMDSGVARGELGSLGIAAACGVTRSDLRILEIAAAWVLGSLTG